MRHDAHEQLLQILKRRGFISASTHKVITSFMSAWGVDAFRAVIETHLIEEGRLADILSEELKLPRLSRLRMLVVSEDVLLTIPYDVALELAVLPFEISESGRLQIVMADPSIEQNLRTVEGVTQRAIDVFVGEHTEIISAIQMHYPLSMQIPGLLKLD
jgi:hypothetical protein